jgi:aminoglycoside phosphotransferase (APT) family kinase protein
MVEEPEAYGLGPILELEFQVRGVVNTTYRVRLASGETWMLRILPRGLGALETERAATALAGEAGLRVPRERGRGALDHPYWIGSWIPGERLDDWLAAGPSEGDRRRVGEAVGRDLAALHAMTLAAPGALLPGGEVRPAAEEPVGRSLRRWLGEDRTRASLGEAGVVAVREAYEARRPALAEWASHAALLHGDPAQGNLLVDADGIVGWVDWEWARVGDPAWDLAILLGREAPEDPAWREGVEAGYGPLPPRERREAYELLLAVEALKISSSAPEVRAWARARLAALT